MDYMDDTPAMMTSHLLDQSQRSSMLDQSQRSSVNMSSASRSYLMTPSSAKPRDNKPTTLVLDSRLVIPFSDVSATTISNYHIYPNFTRIARLSTN